MKGGGCGVGKWGGCGSRRDKCGSIMTFIYAWSGDCTSGGDV